ncbi:MAG: DNA polymerase III subunit delta [Bacteroidetes bacterium]|nr:DNA polymerase III subunit delta [Bacteroidota bacterium]MDA0903571.1 DNA polymerase III subunit delta [Bacteroidota bacterium]MDA1242122.1 DNA polymerase III subunit delta [Bacteroidota bacterium]
MRFADVVGHEALGAKLRDAVRSSRVAHAQLFDGREGSGALALARAYAQFLTCQNPSESDSCGVCTSCKAHANLQHPDLHWCFPFFKADGQEKATSDSHQGMWREAMLEGSYLGVEDWLERLGADRKQLFISVDEALEVSRKLGLKSFYGGWKVWICWLPETMRVDTANKFLKLVEEPTDKTVLLFVSEHPDRLLATIRSRVQRVHVPDLGIEESAAGLVRLAHVSPEIAQGLAHSSDGNLALALRLAKLGTDQPDLERFADWMRACWSRDGQAMVEGSEAFGSLGRESQKRFLHYALHLVRQSIVGHYGAADLVRLTKAEAAFLDKFSRFIHHDNVKSLRDALEEAHADVAGNVNGKLVFVDLSLRVHHLLRVPASQD